MSQTVKKQIISVQLAAPRLIPATRTNAKMLSHRPELLPPSTDSKPTRKWKPLRQPLRGSENHHPAPPRPPLVLEKHHYPQRAGQFIRPLSYTILNTLSGSWADRTSNSSPWSSVPRPEYSQLQCGWSKTRTQVFWLIPWFSHTPDPSLT